MWPQAVPARESRVGRALAQNQAGAQDAGAVNLSPFHHLMGLAWPVRETARRPERLGFFQCWCLVFVPVPTGPRPWSHLGGQSHESAYNTLATSLHLAWRLPDPHPPHPLLPTTLPGWTVLMRLSSLQPSAVYALLG